METQEALESRSMDFDSTVDASRPFRSVKEAVAIFGDRLLTPPRFSLDKQTSDSSMTIQIPNISPTRETHAHKPSRFALENQASDSSMLIQSPIKSPSNAEKQAIDSCVNYEPTPSPRNPYESEKHGNIVHGNDLVMMLMVLKKLESEVQETKMELKLLKERESETAVALASLNAELHKNMSKIAKGEAVEAAKAALEATAKSTTSLERGRGKGEIGTRDGEKAKGDVMVKNLDSPTLAQILSISDYGGYFQDNKNVSSKLKKKPIVPLVTDFFPWKKRSSPTNDLLSPLFSSHMYYA